MRKDLDVAEEVKIFRQLRFEYNRFAYPNPSPVLLPRPCPFSLPTRLSENGTSKSALYEAIGKEFETLAALPPESGEWKCPTVTFGRTGLKMPIITCGGMRQQQTWKPKEGMTLEDVDADCQANYKAILERAMSLGINHLETAKGYGCSELQMGPLLKAYPRESFILQTKVVPSADPAVFRQGLEASFAKLQVEYLDLFAFHGVNRPQELEWVLREGGCMEVVEEYRAAGKIRWVGFSSHGHASTIYEAISSNKFDYVNLHWHLVGSYHASGTWQAEGGDHGNKACLEKAKELNMGCFIISGADKAGMLYKPSTTFASVCAKHKLSPQELGHLFLWQSGLMHTVVCGAARPSDFDEACNAAKKLGVADIEPALKELHQLMVDAHGEEWLQSWWKGLPGCYESPNGVFIPHIVWCYNLVKAWGLLDFARARYGTLEGNLKGFKPDLTEEENVNAINSFIPGTPYQPELRERLVEALAGTPHAEEVMRCVLEAHKWLRGDRTAEEVAQDQPGWRPAYDLQADTPFPERGT
ncbi:unnamed protein product [Chrysoparadoxa australica]